MCIYPKTNSWNSLKQIFFQQNKKMYSFYQNNFSNLLKNILLDYSTYQYIYLQKEKKLDINNFMKSKYDFSKINQLIDIGIAKYSTDLNVQNIDLQSYKDIIIPTPIEPDLFQEKLDVFDFFINLKIDTKLQKSILNILKSSDLNEKTSQFETILKNNKSIIRGNNNNNFSSLRFISHELGHCIYETNHEYRSVHGLICSEVYAYIMELFITSLYLRNNRNKQIQNNTYTSNILKLNHFFYNVETNDISKEITFQREDIKEESYILRPSYYALTGLQYVYIIASIIFLDYVKKFDRTDNLIKNTEALFIKIAS